VAIPGAGSAWRSRLAAELLAGDQPPPTAFAADAFGAGEIPYLYHYLVRTADSADIRNQARGGLARCLRRQCGLEPGLRQHLLLLEQGCDMPAAWLEVAAQLERTGTHSEAKRVYEWILKNTDSSEQAQKAFEGFARILLLEWRQREAGAAWDIFSRRFPDAKCTAPDLQEFLKDFRQDRAQARQRLLSELARTRNGPRALHLCWLLDALCTSDEALSQWQTAVDGAESGSPADHLGRLFRAKAMLDAGKTDASQTAIRGLTESSDPLVRARSLILSGEIARAKGRREESVRLYSQAVRIDRPTALPSWSRALLQVSLPQSKKTAAGLQARMLFLRGCNDLIDGDYAAAADYLSRAAEDSRSLPDSLRRILPCMTMLAWLGLGDLAEAEAWGYRSLEACRTEGLEYTGTGAFLVKIQDVDTAVCRLLARARSHVNDASAALTISQDALDTCASVAAVDALASDPGMAESGMPQMYARIKKRHVARILTAECRYLRLQCAGSDARERMSDLDSLVFTACVLRGDSFDRVKEDLASLSDAAGANDRLYRLAMFAHRAHCPDLAASALDAAAAEQSSAANPEILERIAEMYLGTANHQKAVEIYKRLLTHTKESDKSWAVQFKIIDIYAENLKNYTQAIQECQEFIRRYPRSPQTSQVEFLMGRLSYLARDYAGAVGQLDGFRTRFPEHSQVGQAMLLAGLSRMAEGNAREAIGRFTEIIRKYPDGELAARSKFLIGYAQVSSQQYAAAQETLEQLLEQFPDSQYVPQARSLIERLKRVSR